MAIQTIQEAKLIVYGKSFIEGDQHITIFKEVLWGEYSQIKDKTLLIHTVKHNHDYGDHQIFFYRDNEMQDEIENWAVYEGEIPAWDDKTFEEFMNYLRTKKV